MNNLLNYIDEKGIFNDKSVSRSLERKLLKTFDFEVLDYNISGVLNYIWKMKNYEVLICYDNNTKIERKYKDYIFEYIERSDSKVINVYIK